MDLSTILDDRALARQEGYRTRRQDKAQALRQARLDRQLRQDQARLARAAEHKSYEGDLDPSRQIPWQGAAPPVSFLPAPPPFRTCWAISYKERDTGPYPERYPTEEAARQRVAQLLATPHVTCLELWRQEGLGLADYHRLDLVPEKPKRPRRETIPAPTTLPEATSSQESAEGNPTALTAEAAVS